jgi:hypothetical protein
MKQLDILPEYFNPDDYPEMEAEPEVNPFSWFYKKVDKKWLYLQVEGHPLIPKLDELKREYNLYFLFTITGLKDILEDNVIPPEKAIEQLKYISRSFSPNHIQ